MLPVVAAIHHAHAFLPSEAGEAAIAGGSALGETETNHETHEGQGRPHDQRTVGWGGGSEIFRNNLIFEQIVM